MPPPLLACARLWLLDVTANPITADQLRSTPGWEAFDERRKAKADKRVSGHPGMPQLHCGLQLRTACAPRPTPRLPYWLAA